MHPPIMVSETEVANIFLYPKNLQLQLQFATALQFEGKVVPKLQPLCCCNTTALQLIFCNPVALQSGCKFKPRYRYNTFAKRKKIICNCFSVAKRLQNFKTKFPTTSPLQSNCKISKQN